MLSRAVSTAHQFPADSSFLLEMIVGIFLIDRFTRDVFVYFIY